MSPLNSIMNFAADLSQRPSLFQKQVSSRCVNAVCFLPELLAIFENILKLPFQTAAFTVKIPAKTVNVVFHSKTLKEFESSLPGPCKVLTTALKIAGYVFGAISTVLLGSLSPYSNFKLHCALGLITNEAAEQARLLAEENKRQKTEANEKVITERLVQIILAMQKKIDDTKQLTEEQLIELERLTKAKCPPIQEVQQKTTILPEPAALTELETAALSQSAPVDQELAITAGENERPSDSSIPSPLQEEESPTVLMENEPTKP